MNKIIYIIFSFLICAEAEAQQKVEDISQLQDCDLLFHLPDMQNSITDVTCDLDVIKTDHVAIFFRKAETALIIEAAEKGVMVRRADSLINDGGAYVFVRVSGVDRNVTLANAFRFLGKSYDFKFSADDNEMYCSELVQKSFVDNDGNKIFKTIPMSFHDSTGKVTQYWKDYYRQRWNTDVPEGEEGSNPADIYSQALKKR